MGIERANFRRVAALPAAGVAGQVVFLTAQHGTKPPGLYEWRDGAWRCICAESTVLEYGGGANPGTLSIPLVDGDMFVYISGYDSGGYALDVTFTGILSAGTHMRLFITDINYYTANSSDGSIAFSDAIPTNSQTYARNVDDNILVFELWCDSMGNTWVNCIISDSQF